MVLHMGDWITNDNAAIIEAWATAGGLLAAVIGAAIALFQLNMIRKDSRDRTRPYVQLDVVPGLHGPGSWDLVIENTGASAALELVIDAGELKALDADDHIVPDLGKYLLAPKTLVPGARRRVMWGADFKENSPPIRAGILELRDVSVTYIDEWKAKRWWRRRRPYTATFTVGDAFEAVVFPSPVEGAKPNNKDMLAHIDRALRTLNIHVGELRR